MKAYTGKEARDIAEKLERRVGVPTCPHCERPVIVGFSSFGQFGGVPESFMHQYREYEESGLVALETRESVEARLREGTAHTVDVPKGWKGSL